MEYYIILPGDKFNADTQMFDTYKLGEQSFNVFWAADGLKTLMKISKRAPALLEEIKIKDSKSKEYTVEEFLNIIKKLEIRVN